MLGWFMFFAGERQFIGQFSQKHSDNTYTMKDVRSIDTAYITTQEGVTIPKTLILPVIPFMHGIVMQCVTGPLIPMATKEEELPDVVQKALAHSRKIEQESTNRYRLIQER